MCLTDLGAVSFHSKSGSRRFNDGTLVYHVLTESGTTGTAEVVEDGYNLTTRTNMYYGDIVIPETVVNGGITYTVTAIGSWAFESKGVNSVSIPNSVTAIQDYAFRGSWLTSIEIPSSVQSIGLVAFAACRALTQFSVDENSTAYQAIDGVLFTKDGTRLVAYPAGSEATSYVVPDSVKTISNSAFEKSYSLVSVSIPDTVTTIEGGAFFACKALHTIDLPPITSIDGLFMSCESLVSVHLPDTVTSIGSYAFSGCTALTTMNMPPVLTSIGTGAFSGTAIPSIVIPNTVTSIGGQVFSGCTSLASVSLPDSLTSMYSLLFGGCTSLTSVDIPSTVTFIDSYVFQNCTSLTSLYFHGNAPALNTNVFYGCNSGLVLYYPSGATGYNGSGYSSFTRTAYTPYALTVINGNGSGLYASSRSANICAVVPSGRIFHHWTTSGGGAFGDVNSINTTFIMPSGAVTVTAVFQPVITFNTNGGSAQASQTITYNGLATPPPDPTRTGYAFAGWYKETALNNQWAFDTDTVSSDITLWAKWTPVPYSITYNLDGGTVSPANPTGYTAESVAIALNRPAKIGYNFTGWSGTGITGTSMNVTIPAGSTGNRAYIANWIIASYTVSFNSRGGSSVQSQTIQYNAKVSRPADPTFTGHPFGGWYKDAGYTTLWDFENDRVTADTMLHANWNISAYTITFDSQGGSAVASQSIAPNGLVSQPANPTRARATFAGWFKDAACTSSWTFATDRALDDTILYAKWTINYYLVTFDSQRGSAVASQNIVPNGVISRPSNPTRTGYSFSAWYKEAACTNMWNFTTNTVAADITLFAKWTPTDFYSIVFNSKGGSAVATQSLAYDCLVTKPADPSYPGFIFGGWYKEDACVNPWNFETDTVTTYIQLYAKWTDEPSGQFTVSGGTDYSYSGCDPYAHDKQGRHLYAVHERRDADHKRHNRRERLQRPGEPHAQQREN